MRPIHTVWNLPPGRLALQATISAAENASLRLIVAGNPAIYPQLVTWLAEADEPEVTATLERAHESRQRWAAAGDEATPQQELAILAYDYPELRGRIAANPSAYGELRTWIEQAGDRTK